MTHLAESEKGTLISGLADEPALRWTAVDLAGPLRAVTARLDLSPVAAGALGRCLTGAVLLQRMTIKTPSRLVLAISGDGPLSRVMAEVEDNGDLRGAVSAPQLEIPTADPGVLGVGEAIGNGLLRVWKETSRLSYESQVRIEDGRIGDALAHYLEQSEQTRSAVLLGVLAEKQGITAAGGIMIEALPGPEEPSLGRFEDHLAGLSSVSRILAADGLDGLIEKVVGPAGYRQTEASSIRYHCRCSDGRIRRFLSGLETTEREALRTESGELEAECVFCGQRYRFDDIELDSGTLTPIN